ncbi:MAG: hypothetical protein AB1585_03930 [Thermodesulfobacteriota bacterium]
MEFPLISCGFRHFPSRESSDRSAAAPSEHPHQAQTTLARKLLVKSYHPIGNTLYIDVELEEEHAPDGLRVLVPSWPNFQARKAFHNYQCLAEIGPPKELHTVDFFI